MSQSCKAKLKAIVMHATKDYIYVVTWSKMWYGFNCMLWWFTKKIFSLGPIIGITNAMRNTLEIFCILT